MRKWLFLALFLALCCLISPVSAGLVAYDGLDAAAGALSGVASGWNLKAWDVQNQNQKYLVASPGLTYGSLAVTGNRAVGGGDWVSSGIAISMPAPWDPQNEWSPYCKQDSDFRYKAGAEGTTLWASFLVSCYQSGNDFSVSLTSRIDIPWWPGSGFKVGPSSNVWTLSETTGTASASTGVSRALNQTYLMALKIDFIDASSDRVTLYVDPTPGGSTPDVIGTSIMTTSDLNIGALTFYPGSGSNVGALDEIRFGTSYADVAPVPEPATMLLLGIGGVACIVRRRRK